MSEELLQKGIKAFEEKNFDLALELAKQIQIESPDSADGYHFEGLIQQSLSNWEDSVKSLSKAIGESPYDPNLYNFRGFAYMNMDELKKAEADFKEAIELEDFEPAHRNYVLWYILNDKIDTAIEYLTNRIKLNPENAENLMLMGDLLGRAGYEDNAQSYYEEADRLHKLSQNK